MASCAAVYCWSLGQGNKNIEKDCCKVKDCVLAFVESFVLTSEDCVFYDAESYTLLLRMKCLREVEEIVKEACKTTPLNDIVGLVEGDGPVKLTSSDCQLSYVKSLIWNFQVLKVPDKILYLLESKCLLNHEHSNLVNLFVYEHDVPDENLSAVCCV